MCILGFWAAWGQLRVGWGVCLIPLDRENTSCANPRSQSPQGIPKPKGTHCNKPCSNAYPWVLCCLWTIVSRWGEGRLSSKRVSLALSKDTLHLSHTSPTHPIHDCPPAAWKLRVHTGTTFILMQILRFQAAYGQWWAVCGVVLKQMKKVRRFKMVIWSKFHYTRQEVDKNCIEISQYTYCTIHFTLVSNSY